MKTISELNSKIWYRALKVIYVLIFIPIFLIPILLTIASEGPQFDNEKSYIECDDEKTFDDEALKKNGVDIPLKFASYLIPQSVNDLKIKRMCSESSFAPIGKNYSLISVYTKRNWFKTIGISILSIVATILLFELIKRIFYYIVLGSFKPQKQK